jgi:hypothetical protein
MGAYGVNTSSNITAARYQINGSTMVAILPGLDSIAYGVYAGASNTAGGNYNVFIGNYAGTSNTTGAANTATGMDALYTNTTGVSNTATGMEALYYNTTGDNNTATGEAALSSNMTGANNTATGYAAGLFSRTGSANTLFGYSAGEGTIGVSFSSSTIMGYQAGLSLTTGSDNLLLGWQTGDALTTGSRNIIIGYDIDAQSATGSDQLSIGNLIFATGGFGTGTTVGTGKVGIGTASPGYTLTVNGNAWFTSSAWSGSDRRWKKDISPLEGSLNKIMNLQGVRYNWKTGEFPELKFSTATQIGLIAQDTEEIVPEVVTTDSNGYKGISYEKLVPVLIEAVKEQQKKITELELKVTRLEKKGN